MVALWKFGSAVRVQSAAVDGWASQTISVSFWLQLVDDIRSLAAGTGIALSGVPMVCQREEQKEGLVVELSVVAAILTS